jgi:PII-like signaling protein
MKTHKKQEKQGIQEEAAMRLSGPALRLTVLIGESDTWHHRPLYTEIVHRAHAAGLAGASVFRGIEGFGGSSLIHTSRLLSLSEDLPVAIVIVDTEERVRAFLPQLEGLVSEGLVVLDPCEVVNYAAREPADATDGEVDGGAAAEGEA